MAAFQKAKMQIEVFPGRRFAARKNTAGLDLRRGRGVTRLTSARQDGMGCHELRGGSERTDGDVDLDIGPVGSREQIGCVDFDQVGGVRHIRPRSVASRHLREVSVVGSGVQGQNVERRGGVFRLEQAIRNGNARAASFGRVNVDGDGADGAAGCAQAEQHGSVRPAGQVETLAGHGCARAYGSDNQADMSVLRYKNSLVHKRFPFPANAERVEYAMAMERVLRIGDPQHPTDYREAYNRVASVTNGERLAAPEYGVSGVS